DCRWISEQDRTFYVNRNCTANPPPAGSPGATTPVLGTTRVVPPSGTNFHTSYMPLVATGCTGPLSCESGQSMLDPAGSGAHIDAVCDIGNGVCEPGTQQTPVNPGQVVLNPTKRYYISVLPGDAANPFESGNAQSGHGMGGAPIVTCPKYESDNATQSPIAGQAVVANVMPGRYGVVATPAADRIARGEGWLQTSTLDGQKAHDSLLRIGEPGVFQEYGPAGYH